jgi:hypothetical protein
MNLLFEVILHSMFKYIYINTKGFTVTEPKVPLSLIEKFCKYKSYLQEEGIKDLRKKHSCQWCILACLKYFCFDFRSNEKYQNTNLSHLK